MARDLTDVECEALADEAERGYDVSGQPPMEPEVWLAELVSGGRVVGRVVLTTREDADQALHGGWRIIRYVRSDLARGYARAVTDTSLSSDTVARVTSPARSVTE